MPFSFRNWPITSRFEKEAFSIDVSGSGSHVYATGTTPGPWARVASQGGSHMRLDSGVGRLCSLSHRGPLTSCRMRITRIDIAACYFFLGGQSRNTVGFVGNDQACRQVSLYMQHRFPLYMQHRVQLLY